MKKPSLISRFKGSSRTNKLIAASIALVVIIAGFVLIRTYAAGFLFATEAEQGAVSGTAEVVDDATASGGKAIVFKPAPTPPPPTTPPTTPPTGLLKGWELNASNVGLAPKGLNCASLPEYTGSTSPAAGTVIKNVRVTKGLSLYAGNITIEQSCIQPTTLNQGQHIVTTNGPCGQNSCPVAPTPVYIRDSEIDASKLSASTIGKSCAFLGVGTLERNYMHGMGTGICFFNTGSQLNATATNNYVHQLRHDADSHNEAATIRDFETDKNPNRRLVFLNNRFDSSSGQDTGALFIQTYGGNIDQVTVEGNLLEGQGYQLGLEAGFGNTYGRNMKAINNRFTGTGWGAAYVTRNGVSYGWGEWKDNYLYKPGATDAQGSAIGAP